MMSSEPGDLPEGPEDDEAYDADAAMWPTWPLAPGPDNPVPARILGIDDWLILGRTADGRLVFTQVETDPHWYDTSFRGEGAYESPAWRSDWLFMFMHVSRNREDYHWEPSGTDTDGTPLGWAADQDDEFAERSARAHLPYDLGPMPADQGTSVDTRPLLCIHSESDGGQAHWLPAGVKGHKTELEDAPGDEGDGALDDGPADPMITEDGHCPEGDPCKHSYSHYDGRWHDRASRRTR